MTRSDAFAEPILPDLAQTRHPGSRALRLLLGLVGAHSVTLGLVIYTWPDWFSMRVFATEPESSFFLRQTGVFLLCLGAVYGFPALNLPRYHRLVPLVIGTKVIAVLFLIGNARLTPAPHVIRWAALADGLMALALGVAYALARGSASRSRPGTVGTPHDPPG